MKAGQSRLRTAAAYQTPFCQDDDGVRDSERECSGLALSKAYLTQGAPRVIADPGGNIDV